MTKAIEIHSVEPDLAIPDGEISIHCAIEDVSPGDIMCLFDGVPGKITAASTNKLLVRVPDDLENELVRVVLSDGDVQSDAGQIRIGRKLCGDLHIVANPAVDPRDGSVVVTRSGTRGQELPVTLFRYSDGKTSEMGARVLNPTGVAFDSKGQLFVTNRADGEVLQINDETEAVPIASDLGVATGIAFDASDNLFVGDRGGSIYKISTLGDARDWANIEASVSAFHMAFGPDGSLYVTAPGLCSHDVIHRIDTAGFSDIFFKGLGRPQGIAFDDSGNLYVAACLRGRHGVVRIDSSASNPVMWLAGMSIVGLCFDLDGSLIVATADCLYGFEIDTYGILV